MFLHIIPVEIQVQVSVTLWLLKCSETKIFLNFGQRPKLLRIDVSTYYTSGNSSPNVSNTLAIEMQ